VEKDLLNSCQLRALEVLEGAENVFLTGVAGSGKSFLVRHFMRKTAREYPILASTGAAAILVGGRTFHSFFGLGIMQGGYQATVDRALDNRRVVNRLVKTKGPSARPRRSRGVHARVTVLGAACG
jgi:ATP-dependent DNA helicase PIF1